MRNGLDLIRAILEAGLTFGLAIGVLGVTGLTIGAALSSGASIA